MMSLLTFFLTSSLSIVATSCCYGISCRYVYILYLPLYSVNLSVLVSSIATDASLKMHYNNDYHNKHLHLTYNSVPSYLPHKENNDNTHTRFDVNDCSPQASSS